MPVSLRSLIRRIVAAAACAAALLVCGACGGRGLEAARLGSPKPEPRDMIRGELLAEIDAWNGAGFDAAVAEQLRRSMRVVVESDARQRYTSKAPAGQGNTITDLSLGGTIGAQTLTWSYRNVGDYDRNSEVNIADLSSIGLHFQKTVLSPDWETASAADGDENGEVNVADVTPIGANIFSQFDRYRVLAAVDGESEMLSIGEVLFADGDAGVQGGFQFAVPAAGGYKVFAVEPLDSSGAAGQRSILVGEGIVLGQLPGAAGAKANDNLPQIRFPQLLPEDTLAMEDVSGLSLVNDRMAVMFNSTATVAAVNAWLTASNFTIIGAEPLLDIVVVGFEPVSDDAALAALLSAAAADPVVMLAAPDFAGVELFALPPYSTGYALWHFGMTWPLPEFSPGYHNWGLESVRGPQAWNLATYAQRNPHAADAMVIDNFKDVPVFYDFADFGGRVHFPVPISSLSAHGNEVVNVLGSSWGNQKRLDSLNPLGPQIYCYDVDQKSLNSDVVPGWTALLQVIAATLTEHPTIVDVNISFGFPRGAPAQIKARYGGMVDQLGDLYHEALGVYTRDSRSNFLICSAVGYEDSVDGTLLPYDNVFNNANVRHPGGHIISVEGHSSLTTYNRTLLPINLGGDVSAPGFGMPYDGTSFAAPTVGSLITYLWAMKPGLDWQTVRTLVTGPAYTIPTTGGIKPHIDAFAAVMGIDAFPIGFTMQKALVDVDDGTADGQLRADPFGGAVFSEIDTLDGRRGDSVITMRDLRCWRDAFVQVQTAGPLLEKKLDGPALHFKKDLNFDGVIGAVKVSPAHAWPWIEPSGYSGVPAGENVYPRCDFNGDGVIDMEFRQVNGLDRRDIDLLADNQLWQSEEPNGYREGVYADPTKEGAAVAGDLWSPARWVLGNRDAALPDVPAELSSLPDYLHSCDVHLKLDFTEVPAAVTGFEVTVSSDEWPDGVDNNGQGGIDEPYEITFDRKATFTRASASPVVVTMPLWTRRIRINWKGIGGDQPEGNTAFSNVKFGADQAATIPPTWSIKPIGHRPLGMQIVDGRPAVITRNFDDYFYVRAADAWGEAWEAPIPVTSEYSGDSAYVGFYIVGGKPALLLKDVNNDVGLGTYYLELHQAADSIGSAWPEPSIASTGQWIALDGPSQYYGISGIQVTSYAGGIGLLFTRVMDGGDFSLQYRYSPNGAAWSAPLIPPDAGREQAQGLAIVEGRPCLIYTLLEDTPSVFRCTALIESEPNVWSTPAQIAIGLWQTLSTIDASGRPALAAFNGAGTAINFYRGKDPQGTAWDTGFTFESGLDVGRNADVELVMIDGHPASAFSGPGATEVRYIRANEEFGDSWPLAEEKVRIGIVNSYVGGLVSFDGRPAFTFTDDGDGYIAIRR